MKPLVSILIPVYNREVVVKRAIDSALSQTYNNIEVIVCDNASTDHTWEVLQQYTAIDNRVKIYRNEQNVGPVRNWKECLKHASGKYGKFLWSDDEILPQFVEIMVEALENNSHCGFAYSAVEIRLNDRILQKEYELSKTGYYNSRLYVEGTCFDKYNVPCSPGCAMFRLKTLRENIVIEISNEEHMDFSKYGAGNDQLFFLYTCEMYNEMYYVNESLSIFYGGEDSITITNQLDHYYTIAIFYFLRQTRKFKDFRNKYYKEKLFHERDYYLVPHYKIRRCIYWIRKSIKKVISPIMK